MKEWREILSWKEFEYEVLKESDPRTEKALYTFLLNKIVIDYQTLVKFLGPPTFSSDHGSKVDVKWIIYFPEIADVMTIYNYKDGRNYLGEEGLDKEDIKNWHVGGHRNSYTDKIYELLMMEK